MQPTDCSSSSQLAALRRAVEQLKALESQIDGIASPPDAEVVAHRMERDLCANGLVLSHEDKQILELFKNGGLDTNAVRAHFATLLSHARSLPSSSLGVPIKFPLAPTDAYGRALSVGSAVKVLSVESCVSGLPPEDQERLVQVVGRAKQIVEFDRFGFAWLCFGGSTELSADFCLFPSELALL